MIDWQEIFFLCFFALANNWLGFPKVTFYVEIPYSFKAS